MTFPQLKRVLPKELHRTWTTTVDVAPQTRVTIEAHRHGGRSYSSVLALDAMEIRLTQASGERTPIRIGPNVYIARYVDAAGREIRGAAPPEELYLQGWLKSVGAPESGAIAIQERSAQAYNSDALDH